MASSTTIRKRVHTTGFILLLVSVIIGPLWAGSYYQDWRWPLIITAGVASCILTLSGPRRAIHHWRGYLLTGMIVLLGIQGIWMWYNAWGTFSYEIAASGYPLSWSIKPLEYQPFPAMPGSADRAETWDKLSYILVCLLVVWATRCAIITKGGRAIRTLLNTLFWTGIAVSTLGLAQRWTGAESIYWSDALKSNYGLFFGTYRSPGIASCLLNVSLAAGLALLLKPVSKSRKNTSPTTLIVTSIARIVGISILISGIASAGSKAGSVLGIITLLLWAIMNHRAILSAFHRSTEHFPGNRKMERNIVATALLLASIMAVLSFSGTVIKRWGEAHEKNYSTLTGRNSINDIIINSLGDPNWNWGALGHGPGSFFPLFPVINRSSEAFSPGIYVYAHNDYIQTLFEWGWLGASLFAIMIGGAFLMLAKEVLCHKRGHEKRDILYMRGCLIAMFTFLIHATVDFPFQIESLAVIFSILLGIAWASPSLRDTSYSKPTN